MGHSLRDLVLNATGKFAFYLTVQDVAREGLDGALGVKERQQLNSWRDSDQVAWLFVDSIDEAKLDGLRLETALRKLADGIHRAPTRAHIIVSGRITDWEFRADLKRFAAVLPVKPDRTQPAPPSANTILVQALQGEFRRKKEDSAEQPLVVLMATLNEQREAWPFRRACRHGGDEPHRADTGAQSAIRPNRSHRA
jgi:hypothetical protein